MQPLNAIDAIAPAFTRTHQTLAYPFRLGRAWKLCASQYLAFCGSFFVPYPLAFLAGFKMMPQHNAASQALLLGITGFYTVLMLVVLYFGGRMELVAFEMLVTRAKFIAPMWRRYGTRMWPWIGWKVMVGTIATIVVCGAAYLPLKQAVIELIPLMSSMGAHPDPAAMQGMIFRIFKLESVFFILFALLKIPSTLFNDFVLPFFVLEDIPMSAAVKRGLEVFATDPLQILGYLIMKPILCIIGFIMFEIALMICMIPFFILMLFGSVAGSLLLKNNVAVLGFAAILFMIVFYAFIFCVSIGGTGYLLALLESYGIYFLGGRYPLLGNLLEPGPGQPFTPPPVFPSSEERKDDDGSPPMPMNPAVA